MSTIKKDINPTKPKPLPLILKESHKDEDKQQSEQIPYDIDHKKTNHNFNKIISDKLHKSVAHRHKKHAPNIKNTHNKHKDPDERWSCSTCTFNNICIMAYCEMCGAQKPDEESKHDTNHYDEDGDQFMYDARLAKELLLKEQKLMKQNCKKHAEDEELARKLQQELNDDAKLTQSINEQKEAEDKYLAEKLQKQLEEEKDTKTDKNEVSDELMAKRLQIEYEKEMLRLEREKIENERAAMTLYALEQEESANYLQRIKEDEEFAQRLAQKEVKEQEMNEDKVRKLFSKCKREIVSIENISENPKHEIYEKIITEKLKNGGVRTEIERYLWHGTKKLDNLKLIIKNGFDRSYNTTSQYGKGTYFARDAKYSVKGYCGNDSDGIFSILLCKVIVGEYTVGNKQMTAIPMKSDETEYDSLVNDMRNPSIFVVWRDYHATPAFLVKFK